MTQKQRGNNKEKMSLLALSVTVFKVLQQVNSKFNFKDVNADLKLSLLKLIYGTWLVEIAQNGKNESDSKYKIFENS